ncbi:hypothetical protein BX616_004629 [Lobosporangium transversale]|uniref:J domain-containing protein n=1 Tax=Lobosporangium transversale TaxID=64571 RepID=A0A1Y2G6N5_9FUNG|nr:hypothetical protein BCR41DRAFT_364220 [Lobosporangium transversale]KAF9916096.1 hypothetical protein BX616_004629 [Lobosporangium transversale]ORY98369.1 hypothetical protein BCR41DRAFT_364220 [Lobosporangium transversale]|eukprot:XP_021875761.1 hypothetical protein BCR41DRAFT_364220 [Lobosporangium transversale]
MNDPYEDRSMPADSSASGYDEDDLADIENMKPPELDYYAVLNLSKTASEEDIKDSYKRLSRIFHPDKHSDPALKQAAETKFHVINKAFEVLSNPQLRTAYDEYGEEGINTKWEIGHRVKTPQELREEYARLAREKREMELESLVRSRNEITVNINASRVFKEEEILTPFGGTAYAKKNSGGYLSALKRTEIMQLYMKNSFETQFGPRTQFIVGGQMSSRNGMGGGNIIGTIRHTFNEKLNVELGSSLLNPRIGVLKGTYSIDPLTFITGSAQVRNFQGPAPLVLTFGRRITKGATGYMTYRTGEWAIGSWGPVFERRREFSSLALGVSSQDENRAYQIEVQTGLMQSHISVDHTWTLDRSTKVRVGGNVSTTAGIHASIGGDRKVTQHVKVGLALEVSLSGIVIFNIKVKRLGQSLTVPIILAGEFNPKIAFWAAVLPICAITALDTGYVKPKRKKERAQKIAELRHIHADFIAKQKKEAEEAIELLRESTARKMLQEQEKDGLVIVQAHYGNLDAAPELGLVVDVTIPVQALVNNSQLIMPAGHSKSHILGFYDPCLGEKKQLKIRYEFQRRMHEVVVTDLASVAAPVRSHLLA